MPARVQGRTRIGIAHDRDARLEERRRHAGRSALRSGADEGSLSRESLAAPAGDREAHATLHRRPIGSSIEYARADGKRGAKWLTSSPRSIRSSLQPRTRLRLEWTRP